MLKLSETFISAPVLSLRTGGPIGTVLQPIINPNNLKIEGWYVEDRFNKGKLVLLSQDIRDILPQGFAVNDHEVLSQPDDLVRLKEVMEHAFELPGKYVTNSRDKKFGKVTDYAVETNSMYIQKIYVGQSLIKNFSGGTLSVDRSQIIEITNRRIIIEDPVEKAGIKATSPSPAA
jgi:sporulation protein YlmC with PRC-barrel domain